MKKVLVIAAVCLFGITQMNAQSNAIKLNPLGALFGNLGIGFEHALNESSSVQLNVGILSRSLNLGGTEYKYSGFSVSPEYRMYFDEAMRGWYAGGYANYNSVKQELTFGDIFGGTGDDVTTTTNITNIGAGILFGRQWLLGGNENFVIDLNLGVGYQSASFDTEDDNDDDDFTIEFGAARDGINLRSAFSIGYAF
jgi:hypothetical protein